MDRFEYVMVMVSIIIGLALAHLLQGLAEVAQGSRPFRVRSIHLVWVVYMLMFVAFFWWWQFRLQTLTEWTFSNYMFVLGYAGLLYFQSTLLFPKNIVPDLDLDVFFDSQKQWFFGLNVAVYAMDIFDTGMKGAAHFQSLGWEYPAAMAANIIGSLVAIKIASRGYQWLFAVASLAYTLSWALRQFGTLG